MAVNPAHPLAPRANGATETHAKNGQHLAEGAAIGGQHDADAQLHQATAGGHLVGGGFPLLADLGQKVAAGGAGFAELGLEAGAVVAHR